MTANKVQCKQR